MLGRKLVEVAPPFLTPDRCAGRQMPDPGHHWPAGLRL